MFYFTISLTIDFCNVWTAKTIDNQELFDEIKTILTAVITSSKIKNQVTIIVNILFVSYLVIYFIFDVSLLVIWIADRSIGNKKTIIRFLLFSLAQQDHRGQGWVIQFLFLGWAWVNIIRLEYVYITESYCIIYTRWNI